VAFLRDPDKAQMRARCNLKSDDAFSVTGNWETFPSCEDATLSGEVRILMASKMRANEQLNSKQIRVSGILLILGLLIEALTLVWNHPISFWLFVLVGGGFLLSGIAIFLYSLVTPFLKVRSR
jgi:hypothetical protein